MHLVIGNKNYSTWSLRPWLLLDAHQISFEEVSVSLLQDGIYQRLGKFSEACKVPVLIDGDLTIWDSLAICEYLSEIYLGGKGWPEPADDRALARSLCSEMHSGFSALRNELPMNCRALRTVDASKQAKRDIERIDSIWSTYARESLEGSSRLFGQFSIADCFFAPVVLRFATYRIPLSQTADAYASSILDHPSVQRWVAMARNETEIIPEDEAGI